MFTKKENNSNNNDIITSWDYHWQPTGTSSNLKIKDSRYIELTSFVQKNNYERGLLTEKDTPYQGKRECNPCLYTLPSVPNLEMTTNSSETKLSNNPK